MKLLMAVKCTVPCLCWSAIKTYLRISIPILSVESIEDNETDTV